MPAPCHSTHQLRLKAFLKLTRSAKFAELLCARPITHRGLHDVSKGVVENTRAAFAGAIEANYSIECDLQISHDGEAMVFHDPDLGRLTEQTEDVNTKSAKELGQVKFKNSDNKIQTLTELLQQVDGKVPLIIEMKSLVDGDMALAERAVAVLDNYSGPYGIMSFGPMLMRAVKELSPSIPRGAVVKPATEYLWEQTTADNNEEDVTTMLELVAPDFLSYDVRGLPSKFVLNFKSTTKPVICWTIKDQQTADFGYKYCDQITFEGFAPTCAPT